MAQDIIKQALDAAASFKARGVKKAALDVVADFEAKKAAPPQDPNQPAAPGDPVQRTEPAAPPAPAVPAAQPPAPAQPEVEEPEVEEAEESEEAKLARWREELEGELNEDELITAVLEFLKAEDLDLDSYGVKVSDGYTAGTANVELGKSTSYVVCTSEDTAESIAFAQVKQDIQNEPELFNKDFISYYVDEDNLRDQLMSDVEEMVRESPDSYGWDKDEYYETEDFETYTDSEGNVVADPDEVPEEFIEQKAQEQLKDPVEYLENIYGKEDALKEAIRIAGIDEDKAATDAVAADGWQHFLCRYDGNSYDLPSGGVYWRD